MELVQLLSLTIQYLVCICINLVRVVLASLSIVRGCCFCCLNFALVAVFKDALQECVSKSGKKSQEENHLHAFLYYNI